MEKIANADYSTAGLVTEYYFGALIVVAIGLWLLWKAPEFASALTGGVMSSMSGAGSQLAQLGSTGVNAYNATAGGFTNRMGTHAADWTKASAGKAWDKVKSGGLQAYKNMRGIKE